MGQRRFGNGELRQTFRRIYPGWPVRVATLGVRERAGGGAAGAGERTAASPPRRGAPRRRRPPHPRPVRRRGAPARAGGGPAASCRTRPHTCDPPPPPHQLSSPMHTHSALPSSIQKAAQHHARSLVAATPAATRHDALIHCAPCVRGGRGTAGGAYALGRPAARHDAQKAARNAAPPHADATVAVPGGPRPLGPPATLTDGSAAIRTLARARPRTAR